MSATAGGRGRVSNSQGYRFEAGKRFVRKKSLAKLEDSIRAKTKRMRGDSLAPIVVDLNRTLRGWFA